MPTSLLPRRALPLAAALLVLLPASAAASSSVSVHGAGTAQFAARGAAVQFSTFIVPSLARPLTFVLLPVGVRPACSDGPPLRRCARRVRREGQVVRWRLVAPAGFFVPDTRVDARVRIIAATSFDLGVTGCGALFLSGAGSYAINGSETPYNGVVRRRVACRTSGAGAP